MSYIQDYPFGGEPEESEREDLDHPFFLSWTSEEVGNWIEASGYPFYRDCFERNGITGRRLITIHASILPRIGICDFNHIRDISKRIRDLLEVELPPWDRCISLPPREKLASYLECRARTGRRSEALKYSEFSENWEKMKFPPPLETRGFILGFCKGAECKDIVYANFENSGCLKV